MTSTRRVRVGRRTLDTHRPDATLFSAHGNGKLFLRAIAGIGGISARSRTSRM